MGSIIRDFKSNELLWAEQETDLDRKIEALEYVLEKAEGLKEEYRDLYNEASDLVNEVESALDTATAAQECMDDGS